MGASRRALSLLWHRLALVLVVLGLLASPSAFAAAPSPVRMGTTLGPESDPGGDKPVEQARAEDSHVPPADAPKLDSGIKLPAPPSSFNTHDGGWIRFAYEPSQRERVQPLITQADAVRAELVRRLGRPVLSKVHVYVARTPMEMATLAPEGAPFPKYASGVAYSDIGLVLLTILPDNANAHHDLGEIFRHELAHVALSDAVGGRPVPRWLNEGFAVHASGETSFTRLQSLWTATVSNQLLPLERLERTFPTDAVGVSVAYAQAADVVRFLIRRQDEQRFLGLIERMNRGDEFQKALNDAYGLDLATLEYEWREDVKRRYTFWPIVFSGSLVWAGVIGLFVMAWRRRKKRDKETLTRWEKEEAVEAELHRRLATEAGQGRLRIVFARSEPRVAEVKPPPLPEAEVPRVEHDGRWHTLH